MNTSKTIGIAALFAAMSIPIHAISISSIENRKMGEVRDGIPPGDNEVNWVQALVDYHNASTAGPNPFPVLPAEVVTVLNYSDSDAWLQNAVVGPKIENSSLVGEFGAGYQFLLAKYGQGGNEGENVSVIFYLGGSGIDVPDTYEGAGGLSHISLFSGTGSPPTDPPDDPPNNVPDGGSTAALLGAGMLGMAMLRRK